MVRDKLIEIVLRQAGQRQDDTDFELQLRDELLSIQYDLEHMNLCPWFLDSDETLLQTPNDGTRLVAPLSGFLCMIPDQPLYYVDADGYTHELLKHNYSYNVKHHGGYGKPVAYTENGGGFLIFPIPDQVYNLSLIYSKADQVLNSNIENNWLKYARDLLEARLVMKAVTNYTQDSSQVRIAPADVQRALQRLMAETEAKREINADLAIGDYNGS